MPKQYEAIRDKLAKTMPLKEAKGHAAAIFNAKHPDAPVTGRSEASQSGSPRGAKALFRKKVK